MKLAKRDLYIAGSIVGVIVLSLLLAGPGVDTSYRDLAHVYGSHLDSDVTDRTREEARLYWTNWVGDHAADVVAIERDLVGNHTPPTLEHVERYRNRYEGKLSWAWHYLPWATDRMCEHLDDEAAAALRDDEYLALWVWCEAGAPIRDLPRMRDQIRNAYDRVLALIDDGRYEPKPYEW